MLPVLGWCLADPGPCPSTWPWFLSPHTLAGPSSGLSGTKGGEVLWEGNSAQEGQASYSSLSMWRTREADVKKAAEHNDQRSAEVAPSSC